MKYEEFEKTGIFTNGITIGELADILNKCKEFYGGHNRINFVLNGEEHEQPFVQFEYFANGINIYIEEENPR